MAEKKFAGVDGPVETAAVTEDYAAAERFMQYHARNLGERDSVDLARLFS